MRSSGMVVLLDDRKCRELPTHVLKYGLDSNIFVHLIYKVIEKALKKLPFPFQISYHLLSCLQRTIQPAYRLSFLPKVFYPNRGSVGAKNIWDWNRQCSVAEIISIQFKKW